MALTKNEYSHEINTGINFRAIEMTEAMYQQSVARTKRKRSKSKPVVELIYSSDIGKIK